MSSNGIHNFPTLSVLKRCSLVLVRPGHLCFLFLVAFLCQKGLAGPPALVQVPPCPTETTATYSLVRPPSSTNDVEMWLGERIGRFGDYEFPILGGKPGHQTPQGAFRVEWRNRMHYSRQFNNAPMPYSVFFKGGAAIHEGSLSVRSHGCVHVTRTAAARIFNGVREKETRIIVYP